MDEGTPYLKFDINNKALVGWCGRKFFVYHIDSGKLEQNEVSN